MTKVTLWNVIGWILGVFFGLGGISMIAMGAILAGIPLIIASCIMIPPVMKWIEGKVDIELSGGLKVVLVIVLFFTYAIFVPTIPTTYNTDDKNGVNEPINVANQAPVMSTHTPSPQWYDIATWSGSGTKNTETFTIPKHAKEWRISWVTEPDPTYGEFNFQIFVYKSSSTIPIGVAANVIGENVDSTIMRTSGDHYLMINTAQPYTIKVEAKY